MKRDHPSKVKPAKLYSFANGGKIEARDANEWEIPTVCCMGDCHVGELRYIREFHATSSAGESKTFSTYKEAFAFIN